MSVSAEAAVSKRRGEYRWYPYFEAAWAVSAILAFILAPVDVLTSSPVFAVLLGAGALIAVVRVVAAIASLVEVR